MNFSALQHIPLFSSIPEEEAARLLDRHNITEKKYRKGEILAIQDEPCNRLILLLSGSVCGEMSDPAGKVFKVEDIQAPSPLAILFLFGAANRFPVQVTANEESSVLIIPKPVVLRMLTENSTFLKNYLDISANYANRLSQRLHFMSFRTIRQKIAMYILQLLQHSTSDTVRLDQSKVALAVFFGVSRPSLEREFTRLAAEGLIRIEKKEITVPDRQKLIRLVD